MLLSDDLDKLLDILPPFISLPIKQHPKQSQLIELVLDVGRRPEARFLNHSSYICYKTVRWEDLAYVMKRLGKFSGDNRAGLEKTLHRISALRNRQGNVIGLTCRIGRTFFGTVSIVRDILEKKQSILFLGPPGVGKTTVIREIARVLSEGMKKRVVIIDTSNEIAGDGDLPHPSIGKARRMQVTNTQNQHQVMIEAVENHMPEVIIIDEIGTELEAEAARTIAERGVQLVGTAHGNVLENLIKNPIVTDLIGGVQYVTLGDEEAKKRASPKSILERKAPPTFDIAIELHDKHTWIIHQNIAISVDKILRNQTLKLQERRLINNTSNVIQSKLLFNNNELKNTSKAYYKDFGLVKKQRGNTTNLKTHQSAREKKSSVGLFLYVYGINLQVLTSIIRTLQVPFILTHDIESATVVLTLTKLLKNNRKIRQLATTQTIDVQTVQTDDVLSIVTVLKRIVKKYSLLVTQKPRSIVAQSNNVQVITQQLITPLEETRLVIEEIVLPRK